MSTIRVITHHVTFIRFYLDPKKKPIRGYLRCTSEYQANTHAAEMALFEPPVCLNAHRFGNIEVVPV